MAENIDIDAITVESSTHGPLPATVVRPRACEPFGIVLFLYGGGGSHETLRDIAPLLDEGLSAGLIPPMLVACVDVPQWCFYLDDPAQGWAWETVVGIELPSALALHYAADRRPALLGISMGGYGALKIALRRPSAWSAIAAIGPMIEPSLDAHGSPPRNRFHYPPMCPGRLVGPNRDAELYERNHPAVLAQSAASQLRSTGLPIWIDAASRDAVHAHDGAEFLHRKLWELDVLHEYRLHRDADHVGPSLPRRLMDAFAWVGRCLDPRNVELTPEQAALHQALAPAKKVAAQSDPTLSRYYGRL